MKKTILTRVYLKNGVPLDVFEQVADMWFAWRFHFALSKKKKTNNHNNNKTTMFLKVLSIKPSGGGVTIQTWFSYQFWLCVQLNPHLCRRPVGLHPYILRQNLNSVDTSLYRVTAFPYRRSRERKKKRGATPTRQQQTSRKTLWVLSLTLGVTIHDW